MDAKTLIGLGVTTALAGIAATNTNPADIYDRYKITDYDAQPVTPDEQATYDKCQQESFVDEQGATVTRTIDLATGEYRYGGCRPVNPELRR